MKCKIDQLPMSFNVRVWFYEELSHNQVIVYYQNEDGSWRQEQRSNNVDSPPPSLEIPRGFLAALVSEGSEHLPPSTAMAEHLKDVQVMRDRLLTITEHVIFAPATRGPN